MTTPTVLLTGVSVTYSRTAKVRDFESVKAEITLTADLYDVAGREDEAMNALWQMARENVKATILRVIHPNDQRDEWLGLPALADFSTPDTGASQE